MTWDGSDDNGREAPSGVYFYRFASKGLVETKRMLLLKYEDYWRHGQKGGAIEL